MKPIQLIVFLCSLLDPCSSRILAFHMELALPGIQHVKFHRALCPRALSIHEVPTLTPKVYIYIYMYIGSTLGNL